MANDCVAERKEALGGQDGPQLDQMDLRHRRKCWCHVPGRNCTRRDKSATGAALHGSLQVLVQLSIGGADPYNPLLPSFLHSWLCVEQGWRMMFALTESSRSRAPSLSGGFRLRAMSVTLHRNVSDE